MTQRAKDDSTGGSIPAVFLDRDGVIVADNGPFADRFVDLLEGVPLALSRLAANGYALVVVTNQPVVARGVASEDDVAAVHDAISRLLAEADVAARLHFYYCPHHPHANVQAYRVDCDCRKPKPGLLLRAASEHGIDLQHSFIVGDRITDIISGAAVGCTTILVETGRHNDRPIVTSEPIDKTVTPDFICSGLAAAVEWILSR